MAQRRPKRLLKIGQELARVEVSSPSKANALVPVAEEIHSEKRIQYRNHEGLSFGLHVEPGAESLEAEFEPATLARVLSNPIDNSAEAIEGSGPFAVRISADPSGATVTVEDQGKGIPADILPRLMQWGETHGKANGTGLGLYSAKTAVESWGGQISISSQVGVGTRVSLRLPRPSA